MVEHHLLLYKKLWQGMNLNQQYALCGDVNCQLVDNEAIILNLESGDYFSLNNTGTDIFLSIVKNRPLTSLISELKETYGKSEEELKKDITALLQDLIKNNIIRKAS